MTENEVIEALRRELPRRGHEILGYTKGNERGWDVGTHYEDALYAIEAKGITLETPAEKVTARSEKVWDDGFARLVQIAAGRKYLYRVDPDGQRSRTDTKKPDYVVLAVPDTEAFRSQFCWFREHMERAGFGAWFITPDGVVNRLLIPRRIPPLGPCCHITPTCPRAAGR